MKESTWVIKIRGGKESNFWWAIHLRGNKSIGFECLWDQYPYTRRDSAIRGARRMAKLLRISAEVER